MFKLVVAIIWCVLLGQLSGWLFSSYILGLEGFATSPFMRLGAYALLGLALFLYLLRNKFVIYRDSPGTFSPFIYVLLFTTIIGLGLGLIEGSPIVYVGSDTVYALVNIAIYFTVKDSLAEFQNTIAEFSTTHLKPLTNTILSTAIVLSILNILNISNAAPTHTLYLSYLFVAFLYPQVLAYTTIMMLPLLIGLSDLNRAAMLQIFTGFMIFILSMPVKIKSHTLSFLTLILLGLGILWSSGALNISYEGTELSRRINETVAIVTAEKTGNSIPITQRLYEVEAVFAEYDRHSFLRLFLGFGAGAVLDMSDSLDVAVINSQLLGEELTHNIHLLPAAFFYRYGLLGLFCMLLLFWYSTKITIYIIKSTRSSGVTPTNMLCLTSVTYINLAIVNGLPASGEFFSNPLIFVFIAILDAFLVTIPNNGYQSQNNQSNK